jgi:hypothetical protein
MNAALSRQMTRSLLAHAAECGLLTEEPSSNREIERFINTLIDGIKALIDGDELVAKFSIHSPYLAAVRVNAFAKIAFRALDTFAKISLDAIGASGETLLNAIDMLLNTTNLPNETALDTVNTDSEALLNIIDTDSETLFNTIDTPSKTGFDFVDMPSETALDAVNASGKTLLDTVNPPAETALDTVNLPSEAAFDSVDTEVRVIDALGKASVAGQDESGQSRADSEECRDGGDAVDEHVHGRVPFVCLQA